MQKRHAEVDPLPGKFSSYEEAGRFWDEHDTMDYPDAFVDVDIDVELKGRKVEIDIDEDVMEMLQRQAKKSHTRPGQLASQLLRKELSATGS